MPPKRTQSQRATPATQSKQKKAPVSWDKDGEAGWSDFLRNAGSGLQDKDIDNGTTTLNAALTKICRYWDELHPIMALHNISNPPETQESTKSGVPNLHRSRADNNASEETPPQSKKPNVNDKNDTST
ncbi:hypothetical protein PCANC_27880 [Puccinia coronata f. sp. avenae]|uniref:Uncharacterized protein n=1 Tax=Puccinia coronata f. sp. avenae TaxID=200324 RepID=A0A2N5TET7_9BASI|nr:hypothetical protein PCANC_27880 [Puccinia coronata f. sp. avenae]